MRVHMCVYVCARRLLSLEEWNDVMHDAMEVSGAHAAAWSWLRASRAMHNLWRWWPAHPDEWCPLVACAGARAECAT